MLDRASGADRLTELQIKAANVSAKIVWDLGMQQPPTEASFVEQFGPDGHIRFWEAELSGSIGIHHFIDILAKTGAISLDDITKRRGYLARALFDGYQMDQEWFKGAVERLAALRYAGELDKVEGVRLQGRAAAEWLMQHPRWRELVPPTLADFLRSDSRSQTAATHDKSANVWTNQDVTAWFVSRVKITPTNQPWFSLEADWRDAKLQFPGVQRKVIESLREEQIPASRRRRGPRSNFSNSPD